MVMDSVLLVDDDEKLLNILKNILKKIVLLRISQLMAPVH